MPKFTQHPSNPDVTILETPERPTARPEYYLDGAALNITHDKASKSIRLGRGSVWASEWLTEADIAALRILLEVIED